MDIFSSVFVLLYIFGRRTPVRTQNRSPLRTPTVVSTQWVQNYTQENASPTRYVRIIETSFNTNVGTNYTTEYAEGHIPQAVYFDLFKCVNGTEEIPKDIPEVNCITDYIQSLGVWPDTHVIVYTRSGIPQAFRTWWTFRLFGHKNVSVLDGGFQKWLADGYNTSKSIPLLQRSTFEGNLNSSLLRNYDDMVENLDTKREQTVDSRAPDEKWVSDEAYDSGMIPGSKLVSYLTVSNTDGTMKNITELKEIFQESGVNLTSPIVTYCNTGMKSSVVVGAAYILGLEVSMYYGSWNEWRRRAPEELKHRVWKHGFP